MNMSLKDRLAMMNGNELENTHMQEPARKQERGRVSIVFGSICALLGIALFVLAPMVVSSTIDANKGNTGGGLGGVVVRGMGITWATGIAQGMTLAGIFFGIIGLIMIATGVVKEYRRRKNMQQAL
jgi:hypothetical protein